MRTRRWTPATTRSICPRCGRWSRGWSVMQDVVSAATAPRWRRCRPELEPGTPFSINIVALAMYLRFVHAVSYKRLSRLLLDLYALQISEGALDAAFRRGKPCFDADVAGILARLRRARVICAD